MRAGYKQAQLHPNIAFTLKFTRMNYQRSEVPEIMLRQFKNFIYIVTEKIGKQIIDENLSTLIQVIITMQSNFEEIRIKSLEIWLDVLYAIVGFFEKALQYSLASKNNMIQQCLEIFWPFFQNKSKETAIDQLQKKINSIELLGKLPDATSTTMTEKYKQNKFSCQNILEKLFWKQCAQNFDELFKYCLSNSLSIYQKNNPQLIESTLATLDHYIGSENIQLFHKTLKIYMEISTSCQDNVPNFQNVHILINKLIKRQTANTLKFFYKIAEEVDLPKHYRSDSTLEICLIMLEKLFKQQFLDQFSDYTAKAIMKLSEVFSDIKCVKQDLKLKNLLKDVVNHLTKIKFSKNQTEDNAIKSQILFGRSSRNSQQDWDHRIFDSDGGIGEIMLKKAAFMEGNNSSNQEASSIVTNKKFQNYPDYFQILLENCISNPMIKKHMMLSQTQTYEFIISQSNPLENQFVCKLLLRICPSLIPAIRFDIETKNDIYLNIMCQVAERQAKQLKKLQNKFQLFHTNLKKQKSLNQAFVLCLIYLRYAEDKNSIVQYLIEDMNLQLDSLANSQAENSSYLLASMCFLIQALDLAPSTLRINLQQVMKSEKALSSCFKITDFVCLANKEILPQHNQEKQQKQSLLKLINRLNENISIFGKKNLSLLFSILIELNKCSSNQQNLKEPAMIQTIKAMQYNNSILTLFLIYNKAKPYLQVEKLEQDSIIIIYHLFLKMSQLLKQKSDQYSEQSQLRQIRKFLVTFVKKINKDISFNILLELYKSQRNSVNLNQQQKLFTNYMGQNQMIRFYSEAQSSIQRLYVNLNRKGLQLIVQLIAKDKELKKQMVSEENQAEIQEDLQNLKNLYLLYYSDNIPASIKTTSNEIQLMKTFVLIAILMMKPQNIDLTTISLINEEEQKIIKTQEQTTITKPILDFIIEDLQNKIPSIIELYEEEFENKAQIIMVKKFGNFNFVEFLFKSVFRNISSNNKCQYVELTKQILQRSKTISNKIKKMSQESSTSIESIVNLRIRQGLMLQDKAQHDFVENSKKIYQLLSMMIEPGQQQKFKVLKTVRNFDSIDSLPRTKYLLAEMQVLSPFLGQKSQELTEIIFQYLMTLRDTFTKNYHELHLAGFICQFFQLEKDESIEGKVFLLQKNDKNVGCIPQQPSYRCLKCQIKKDICYGCAVTCHKNHPVIYHQQGRSQNKVCFCKDIENNTCKNFSKLPTQDKVNKPKRISSGPNAQSAFGGKPPRFDQYGYGRYSSSYSRLEQQALLFERGGGRISIGQRGQPGRVSPPKYYGIVPPPVPPRIIERQMNEHYYVPFSNRARQIQDLENQVNAEENNNTTKQKDQLIYPPEDSPPFENENYQQQNQIIEQEAKESHSIIESKSYVLPIFMQMTNQICEKGKLYQSVQTIQNFTKLKLQQPAIQSKIANQDFRLTVAGKYSVKVRKGNPIDQHSAAVSKKLIACKGKYIIVASGTALFVYLKQKFLQYILQNKGNNGNLQLNHHDRHDLQFDAHTVQFSPIDDNQFLIAGLHHIFIYSLTSQGTINKNCATMYQMDKDYISKVRFTKLGIFIGCSRQIKMLSYSCKEKLSIQGETTPLIKQWCIFEKANSCILYFVSAQNYVSFGEIDNSDEGRKVFVNRVSDERVKKETGAGIIVKDIPQYGRLLVGSFKDGSNMIGYLQGDQLQDCHVINYKNVFDKNNFIMGHIDLQKGFTQNEFYLIFTLRSAYSAPQTSINQGPLILSRIKGNKIEYQPIFKQSRCESFQVLSIGQKAWIVISMHEDGSLHFSTPIKLQKSHIQEQTKLIKAAAMQNLNSSLKKIQKSRNAIKNLISIDNLSSTKLTPLYQFRQFSTKLKAKEQYNIDKIVENQFQIKYIEFGKIITGITLPFYGNVTLPTRTINGAIEVGFSPLEALYFYGVGSFKVKYVRNDENKYFRDLSNAQILEKFQRHSQSLQNELGGNNFLSNILNRFNNDKGNQIEAYGQSFEVYKSKFPNFDDIFNLKEQSKSNQSQLQKMVQILKIFFQNVIRDENYDLVSNEQIYEFVQKLRRVTTNINIKLYNNVKKIIVMALTICQKRQQMALDLYQSQYHPLKYATQNRVEYYYSILKTQITETDIQQVCSFMYQIAQQNKQLFMYFIAKYPMLFPKIQKKFKKLENAELAKMLLKIYTIVFAVLHELDYNSHWILQAISSIVGAIKQKGIRKSLYLALMENAQLKINPFLSSIKGIDAEQGKKQVPIALEANNNPLPPINYNGGFDLDMYDQQEDVQALIIKLSQLQYQREQRRKQQQYQRQIQELEKAEEQKQMQPELENQMVGQTNEQFKSSLIKGLIEQCMKPLDVQDSVQTSFSKVYTLYVIIKVCNEKASKYADSSYLQLVLTKLTNFLSSLQNIGDFANSTTVMLYLSLFSEALKESQFLKRVDHNTFEPYKKLKETIFKYLSGINLGSVVKLEKIPSLLACMFKQEEVTTNIHIAYGLVNLLQPTCQPNPVLLSLNCYWLFPQSKQYYTKQKDQNTIKQGMKTGDIVKIYNTAKQRPQIWKQTADIEWVDQWIENKRPDWMLALELLTIYYDE